MNILIFLLSSVIGLIACNKEGEIVEEKEVPAIKQNIDETRIAWDMSSMVKVAPASGRSLAYCGYSRMEQLYDGSLACVYETSSGNVELVFSNDLGKTWGFPEIVFQTENNINMAVPDIIELEDQSLLVACNPRPREPYTDDRKFGIKVRKSTDGGKTWQDEQLIYEAQSTFNNGCWEPAFLQLPDGEVQLYFANEGVYTSSDEQNISMFRSINHGESWSEEPIIVGFRQGRRDGMPVPLLLQDKGEILLAVEDNKVGEFKPAIYHEKLSDNWNDGFVGAVDTRRDYHPFVDELSEGIYAGAPFLERLASGEVLLSYQSTLNRSDIWDRSCMIVEVGNDSGTQFTNRSVPFDVPLTKWGLWNSLSVIENGTIPVALTSTNAYSYGSTEVWLIKGHVISEYQIPEGTPTIDGFLNEECWQNELPYFIGSASLTSMSAALSVDGDNLYVGGQIKNAPAGFSTSGKITFQIDTERKGYEKPHEGIFSFECGFNGQVTVKEGSYGQWVDNSGSEGIEFRVNSESQFELAIPLPFFENGLENEIGLNFNITYMKDGYIMNESIVNGEVGSPNTWCLGRFE